MEVETLVLVELEVEEVLVLVELEVEVVVFPPCPNLRTVE